MYKVNNSKFNFFSNYKNGQLLQLSHKLRLLKPGFASDILFSVRQLIKNRMSPSQSSPYCDRRIHMVERNVVT